MRPRGPRTVARRRRCRARLRSPRLRRRPSQRRRRSPHLTHTTPTCTRPRRPPRRYPQTLQTANSLLTDASSCFACCNPGVPNPKFANYRIFLTLNPTNSFQASAGRAIAGSQLGLSKAADNGAAPRSSLLNLVDPAARPRSGNLQGPAETGVGGRPGGLGDAYFHRPAPPPVEVYSSPFSRAPASLDMIVGGE